VPSFKMIRVDARVCDLDLDLRRSQFAPLIVRLECELDDAGIALRPHFYLSTEYGCISGSATIGLLWTDGFREAQGLAARAGIRTRSAARILSVLRHETGHAFCYTNRLYRTARFRALFGVRGSFFETYPEPWAPGAGARRRFARGEVISLYAARHADEDFAVSFEFWLRARHTWRRRYAGKPRVLEKLAYVDAIARELGGRKTRGRAVPLDVPLHEVTDTVAGWMRSVVAAGTWTLLAKYHRNHSWKQESLVG
jgi:hypothetical protein